MSDVVTLRIADRDVRITSARGVEALGRPPRFDVIVDDDVEDPIGTAAELAITLEDGSERLLPLMIDAVERAPGRAAREGARPPERTTLRLVAEVARLVDAVQHEVFLDEDGVAIASALLERAGLSVDRRVRGTPVPRPQCVQAFEGTLAFVTRLLAEEGATWFCAPDDVTTIVVADAPSSFDDVPGGEVLVAGTAGLHAGRSAWGVRLARRVAPDKVTLRDFNFETPSLDMTADASTGDASSEIYGYRGGYGEPGRGRDVARMRLDALRTGSVRVTGTSNARDLAPGRVLHLVGASTPGLDGAWILTEVVHTARQRGIAADERPYEVRFTAVPHDLGARPVPPPRPTFGGLQTTTIVGPGGSEIHTEERGRSRARLRWERTRPADETAGAWHRSLQPATSGGMFIPRVGWEALTAFFQGSPDEPMELGRLYQGTDPPPTALPATKVQTSFGTRTTPGGGSRNAIVLDDSAGAENMTFTASKDFRERTENDKVTDIVADDSWDVGGDRTTIVGKNLQLGIVGSQTYTVGGNRDVGVESNKVVVTGTESVSVGAARIFDVGGDLQTQCAAIGRVVGAAKMVAPIEHSSLLVAGGATVMAGGTWAQLAALAANTDVGGASVEEVAGVKIMDVGKYELTVKGRLGETFASRHLESGGDLVEKASSRQVTKVGASMTIEGADVVFSAQTRILIKAGGVTLKITPGGVTIDGRFDSSQAALDDSSEDYD